MAADDEVSNSLRDICRDVSMGDLDIVSKLEVLADNENWISIRLSMVLSVKSVINNMLGDVSEYYSLATFVASIHPAVSIFVDATIDELQYRVNMIMEIDSDPPSLIASESEDESDRRLAEMGCGLFFYCMDPVDDAAWSAFEYIFENIMEIGEGNLG